MYLTYLILLILLFLLYQWQRFRRPVRPTPHSYNKTEPKSGDLLLFRYTKSLTAGAVFGFWTHAAMIYTPLSKDRDPISYPMQPQVVEFRRKNRSGLFKDGLNITPLDVWLKSYHKYGLVAIRRLRNPLNLKQMGQFDQALDRIRHVSFEHNFKWGWVRENLDVFSFIKHKAHQYTEDACRKGLSCGAACGYLLVSLDLIKKHQMYSAFAPASFSSSYSTQFNKLYEKEMIY